MSAPEPTAAQTTTAARERLLDVRDLQTHFDTREGVVKAVDGVSVHVDRGEVLGIVGESGCGKSVTALSLMKLLPPDVVSEARKQSGANPGVRRFLQEAASSRAPLFVSVVTVGELRRGIETIRCRGGVSARAAPEGSVCSMTPTG